MAATPGQGAQSGRVFVVGDIHGCAAELEVLLRGIPLTAGDTLVCLGDYCDRGPASKEVIDLLLAVEARDGLTTRFLRGNHEDMWLSFLGRDGHWGEAWTRNGGDATLESYGLSTHAARAETLAAMPATHVDFLERTLLYHDTPTHLLVHAGIDPRLPLARQTSEELLWIREDFIDAPHGLGRTVVFGHTPSRQIRVDLPYKVGIDTGCVYGGALTCLSVPEHRVWQVQRGGRAVEERAL